MNPDILKLKRILEKIESHEAPESMLDDLKRIHGYDPRELAREGLSVLADIAENQPVTLHTVVTANSAIPS